jgi:hypothetical protein
VFAQLVSGHSPAVVFPDLTAANSTGPAQSSDGGAAADADVPIFLRGILSASSAGGHKGTQGNGLRTGLVFGANRDSVGEFATLASFNTNSPLWRKLDKVQEQLSVEHKFHVIAGTASLASVGMSIVYFLWAVRAGSVMSSLLSSLPAWNMVDPLPILEQFARGRSLGNVQDDIELENEDETLESMVDGEVTEG